MEQQPLTTVSEILRHLGVQDLKRCRLVCQTFRKILDKEHLIQVKRINYWDECRLKDLSNIESVILEVISENKWRDGWPPNIKRLTVSYEVPSSLPSGLTHLTVKSCDSEVHIPASVLSTIQVLCILTPRMQDIGCVDLSQAKNLKKLHLDGHFTPNLISQLPSPHLLVELKLAVDDKFQDTVNREEGFSMLQFINLMVVNIKNDESSFQWQHLNLVLEVGYATYKQAKPEDHFGGKELRVHLLMFSDGEFIEGLGLMTTTCSCIEHGDQASGNELIRYVRIGNGKIKSIPPNCTHLSVLDSPPGNLFSCQSSWIDLVDVGSGWERSVPSSVTSIRMNEKWGTTDNVSRSSCFPPTVKFVQLEGKRSLSQLFRIPEGTHVNLSKEAEMTILEDAKRRKIQLESDTRDYKTLMTSLAPIVSNETIQDLTQLEE